MGMKFAQTELLTVVALLVREYAISLPAEYENRDDWVLAKKTILTAYPAHNIPVILRAREEQAKE